MTGTAIVKRATVEELVGHRNRALELHAQALAMMESADDAYKRAVAGEWNYGMGSEFRPRNSCAKALRHEIDGRVWRNLLRMTNIGALMDTTARKAFDEQCNKEPPEVTVDNVLATLQDLMGDAGNIFMRSVVTSFEKLPRDYRSNDGFKYGKRIILNGVLSVMRWGRGQVSVSIYSSNYGAERIHDLDRVFHVLDGKEPPNYSNGAIAAMETAIRTRVLPFECETEYFKIKGFAAGTVHLWPRRRDLTEKANRLLAQHYGGVIPDGRKTP